MVKPDIQLGELPSSKEAYTTLFRLAAPSVAEMLLTSLIGMIDTVMVSGLGEEAIAAVGLTTQPRMLVMAIFVALNAGLTAVIARRKGEERRDDANRSLSSMVTVILLLAILLASLAVTFANPIMRFAGAVEGETLEIGMSYYRILIAAAPLNAVTMAINAAQRGIGKTKITMYVNMAANIVNVVFNFLLIEGRFGFPRLEIEGAAIASVIGICVGFIMAIISITVHKGYLRLSIREMLRPSKEALMPVIKVGGNAVLEQVAMRIGFFTFAKIVAGLGTDNMAAHQIILQFTTISFTVGDGIGVAGTSLVGQNLGRKRPDISLVYGKVSQRVAVVAGFILCITFILARYPLLGMFSDKPTVVEAAAPAMIVAAMSLLLQTSAVVISGCLRGSGDTRYVAYIMIIAIAILRPIFSVLTVLVFDWGLVGAWTAMASEITVRLVLLYFRFSSFKWAKIKV